LIYAVGCTVVIQDINSKKQEFLSGHSNNVTCVAVSKSGRYIASGQVTHRGFRADVIIWDFEARRIHGRLSLHKVKVEALAFSPNDKYVATLGGEDDGSIVIWNVATCEAICGSPAQVKSAGMTFTVAYANTSDDVFVTGGNDTLRVWTLDLTNRKIKPEEVNMGQNKRIIKCIAVTQDDLFAYCGTTTGDVLAINMKSTNLNSLSSEKERCGGRGVTSLTLLKTGDLIVGGGDGQLAVFKGVAEKLKRVNSKKLKLTGGSLTSIALRGEGHQFFVGTSESNIYRISFSDFACTLLTTCHYAEVKDVTFPPGTSALFVTASYQDVRVWSPDTDQELLRINVPNMTCNAVQVSPDGRSIITGWDDGILRSFYPESGKPMYSIKDVHGGGITSLALYSDSRHIVTGGMNGDVRVWEVNLSSNAKGQPCFVTKLLFKLHEHKASVTCIKVRSDDRECISSSIDGSCIIWDLEKRCRSQMIRVNTLFKYVCYHPANHQIITSGTDKKIGYFETYDGSMIRELEGSMSGAINAMDISDCGNFIVSGGDDKLVKVWKYDEGEVTHMGIGHSAPITKVKISNDKSFVLSVSTDGAILRWKFPFA